LDLDLLHSPRSEHQNPANVRAEKLSGKIKKNGKPGKKKNQEGWLEDIPKTAPQNVFGQLATRGSSGIRCALCQEYEI